MIISHKHTYIDTDSMLNHTVSFRPFMSIHITTNDWIMWMYNIAESALRTCSRNYNIIEAAVYMYKHSKITVPTSKRAIINTQQI